METSRSGNLKELIEGVIEDATSRANDFGAEIPSFETWAISTKVYNAVVSYLKEYNDEEVETLAKELQFLRRELKQLRNKAGGDTSEELSHAYMVIKYLLATREGKQVHIAAEGIEKTDAQYDLHIEHETDAVVLRLKIA